MPRNFPRNNLKTVFRILVGTAGCSFATLSSVAQDSTQEPRVPVTPVHRAVVIFPPLLKPGDSAVAELRELGALKRENLRRKRSLPGTVSKDPVTIFTAPGNRKKTGTRAEADDLNEAQLNDYLVLCLKDALSERLKTRCNVSLPASDAVNKGMAELKIRQGNITDSEAEKLCSSLDCDAVIVVERPLIIRQDGTQRELLVRNDVRLAALRSTSGKFIPTGKSKPKGGRPVRKNREPGTFTVAVSAVATRAFLKPGFSQEPAEMVQTAAGDLASQVIHTLTSGETYPLNAPRTRLALSSVPAPPDADMLIADGTRRFTETQAVPMLTTNCTDYFHPEWSPLLKTDITLPAQMDSALKQRGLTALSLWKDSHVPDTRAVQSIGKAMNVQFVLISRVSDVQATAYPQHPAEGRLSDEPCREAHAEAVGALIRVQDGEIVWSGRGDATITSREVVKPEAAASANRQACQMAEKFALIDLKRQFSQYRSGFLQ